MNEVMKALLSFFSSFGVPAYIENLISKTAEPPYITFRPIKGEPFSSEILQCRLWSVSRSTQEIREISDRINNALGADGSEGVKLPLESGGFIVIYKGDPFMQMQPIDSEKIQVLIVTMEAKFYTF